MAQFSGFGSHSHIYAESNSPIAVAEVQPMERRSYREICELADDYPEHAVNFVDLGPAFLDSNQLLDNRYRLDGIHLNTEGYLLWKQQIDALIQELTRHGAVEERQ